MRRITPPPNLAPAKGGSSILGISVPSLCDDTLMPKGYPLVRGDGRGGRG